MNWLRRKSTVPRGDNHDPYIDSAREAQSHRDIVEDREARSDERATSFPHAVDADFCYGGDSK
jgi:hypothetical protein